jgi:hypothetical protein
MTEDTRMTEQRSDEKRGTERRAASEKPRRSTGSAGSTDDQRAHGARRHESNGRAKGHQSDRREHRNNGHERRLRGRDVVVRAAHELRDFVGATPTGVVGLDRVDDGWRVSLEVLELRRVPDTSSIMACYDVELDDEGELVGYRRTGRYVRGRTSDE